MSFLPKFIPQSGLDALKHYKYSAEDRSILTKWFLRDFWEWVITLFPLWVACVQTVLNAPSILTPLPFFHDIIAILAILYLLFGVTPCQHVTESSQPFARL